MSLPPSSSVSDSAGRPVAVAGRFSAPSLDAGRWVCFGIGMVLISYGTWRLWAYPDAGSGRWMAIGTAALILAEILAPVVLYPNAEWTVAAVRSALTVRHRLILGAGVVLSVGVDAYIYLTQPADMSDWLLLSLWLVSMILLLAGAFPAPNVAQLRALVPSKLDVATVMRGEVTWIVLIAALGAAVRLIDPTLLYPVRGDEAYHRWVTHFVVGSSTPNLFILDYMDDAYIYFVPQHLFFLLFGDGLAQARFVTELMGVPLAPLAYLLGRELLGRRGAVVTGLIVAVNPLAINYARQNLPQMWAMTFTVAFLFCLVRGLRTGKVGWWIAAGIATGVAQYGHTDARFIVFMAAAVLLYELIRAPHALLGQWTNIGWLVLASVLGYGPTFFNVIHQPSAWTTHSSGMNIFSTGWFSQQVKLFGLLPTLGGQAYSNVIPLLTSSPSSDPFYPSGAMFTPWTVPFAVAGLVRCAVRPFQRTTFVVLSWAIIVFVLGGLVVTPTFGSQHPIELVVPVALMTAIGVDWVAEFLPRIQFRLALAVALVLTLSGLYYFFVMYQPIPARAAAPTYKDDTMTQVGYFVRRIRPDAVIYMFDNGSENYHASPQASWLAGDRTDVVDVLEDQPPAPKLRLGPAGGVFLFLPDYAEHLSEVKRRFPGGRVSALKAPYLDGHAVAVVYTVGHPFR